MLLVMVSFIFLNYEMANFSSFNEVVNFFHAMEWLVFAKIEWFNFLMLWSDNNCIYDMWLIFIPVMK